MARITRVRVWLPAMPPMLATIGISTARATTFSRVSSNRLITAEAARAVSRLMPSHSARRRTVCQTEPKVSSSSSRPAMPISECSASSMITSTTSSMVIRPTSMPSSSTTGAVTRSRRSNSLATSWASWVAGMASTSVIIASRTEVPGSEINTRVSGRMPTNWFLRFTTSRLSVVLGMSPRRRR